MRLLLGALAVCWLGTTLAAAPPSPSDTTVNRTTAVPGDLILFDASAVQADFFDWHVEAPDGTQREPLYLQVGNKLVLASYPGTWRVSLACSNPEGVAQQQWKIVVSGTPGPPPPDDDDPPAPDLSLQAKAWLLLVPASGKTGAVVKDVRTTFDSVGKAATQAGSIAAVDQLLWVGFGFAIAPLGQNNTGHWQTFVDKAQAALAQLKSQGVSVANYGLALQSIARGLQ